MKYHLKFTMLFCVCFLLIIKTYAQQAPDSSPCGNFRSLVFKEKSKLLSNENKTILKTVASKLKENAETNLTLTGNVGSTKLGQQLCYDRLKVIKIYLNETLGITSDRIIMDCGDAGGEINTIDMICSLNQ